MVSGISVIRTTEATWLFTWTPGTPNYEVWLNGVLLATVSTESYTYILPKFNTTPPPLEIVEVSATPESQTRAPFLILQWREISLAISYAIEFKVGSVFEVWQFVIPRSKGYLQYTTPPQKDAAQVEWRIRAMDSHDNFGVPIPFTVDIVKNPDPPSVAITYSAGSVEVGAA